MSNSASLFSSALDAGAISPGTFDVLGAFDIGQQIQGNLGTPADQIKASEVTLVTLLIDDSGSIRFVTGNTEAVRQGHNACLDALKGSKSRNDVLASTLFINDGVLSPYVLLEQAPRLDHHNYNPGGGTPLYDRSLQTLAAVIAKAQEFEDQGVPVRTVTGIVTDGADTGSRAYASDVVRLVNDMLMKENHIICGMGIDDGSTDYYEIFSGVSKRDVEAARKAGTLEDLPPAGGMGIWPKWVLTPGNTPSEIRKAFQVLSQSAVTASQNAGSFSQTAAGGFGG